MFVFLPGEEEEEIYLFTVFIFMFHYILWGARNLFSFDLCGLNLIL